MTTLQFNQILPIQKMPMLAKDYQATIPTRAKAFCYPFKQAAAQGAYLFSPLDFQFKLTDTSLEVRTITDDGSYKTITIDIQGENTNNNFILLSDISHSKSSECLNLYRERIKKTQVPGHIDIENFGFYEVLLNVIVEEEPFGAFIQLWIGGVPITQPGNTVWIKQATNVMMDSGYTCLDAQIDTSQWHGWLAIVLKPTRKNTWVDVKQEHPICQILGIPKQIEKIENIPFQNIENEIFLTPLKWHIFDEDYGKKPGKYQRMMRKIS